MKGEDSCFICGFDAQAALEEHHAVPRSLGGSDAESNVFTLCSNCHKAIEAMYSKKFFTELWAIFENRDGPPDHIKHRPPMGLKWSDDNRLVPDYDDGFDDVFEALRMHEYTDKSNYEIAEETGLSRTTARTLPERRHLYDKYIDDLNPQQSELAADWEDANRGSSP